MKYFAAMSALCLSFSACRLGNKAADFHIINLSLPRTATTSFAGIFDAYQSTHEYMLSKTILALLDYRDGKTSAENLRLFLQERNNAAKHKVDSASFFFLAPEILIQTFKDSKFFLSVRQCEPWIVSMVDNSVFAHQMLKEGKVRSDTSFLDRYSEVFISNHNHETFLDNKKLARDSKHIITDLARTWRQYTIKTLEAMLKVKKENRLIIRTEDFSSSADSFARLAGVPPDTLNLKNIHMNRDRDMNAIRAILGSSLLKKISEGEQALVDAWLKAHSHELN